MANASMARFYLLCGGIAAVVAMAQPAAANLLINGGFDTVGPMGTPVTSPGGTGALSAALGWSQETVVPTGTLTSALLPTTDPFGSGNMVHITTDSGDWPAAEQGNGLGQAFPSSLRGAHLTFDIDVISGSVTGGLTEAVGGGIGVFPPTIKTFGPTGGWIQVTDQLSPGLLSQGVYFETLTFGQGPGFGADYYLDNALVTAPEPASLALFAVGMATLAGVRRRRSN
jgi:hypothetical protein